MCRFGLVQKILEKEISQSSRDPVNKPRKTPFVN